MGREIRRVPPNWEHPRYTEDDPPTGNRISKDWMGHYKPLFDECFEEASHTWKENFRQWETGDHPDLSDETRHMEYWEYDGGPPMKEDYRPPFAEAPTWYQVYETISEGTPVSPPFPTLEELGDYLVANGDFWAQRRGERPPSPEQVQRFLESGYAGPIVIKDRQLLANDETVV